MSFRADAIRDLRFDERLVGVSDGEDVDFCMRLKPGSVLLIAPRARLIHKKSPSGRLGDHWLRRSARAALFLYRKNWSRGVRNRVSFMWLNLGYGIVATFASLRHCSTKPWHALLAGVRDAPRYSGGGCGKRVLPNTRGATEVELPAVNVVRDRPSAPMD